MKQTGHPGLVYKKLISWCKLYLPINLSVTTELYHKSILYTIPARHVKNIWKGISTRYMSEHLWLIKNPRQSRVLPCKSGWRSAIEDSAYRWGVSIKSGQKHPAQGFLGVEYPYIGTWGNSVPLANHDRPSDLGLWDWYDRLYFKSHETNLKPLKDQLHTYNKRFLWLKK